MEQVRAALVGFGGMGRKYAAMIRDGEIDGMVLAGVCCRNAPGQQTLREEFPGVSIYRDVTDTLAHADEFDAVLIVTPHTSHVEIARQMVAAGKHILLDKPAGVYARQVRELVDMADAAGVSFGMIFNNRANAAFVKARELLQSGAVGTPVRAVWVCNTWFRTPAYHKSAPLAQQLERRRRRIAHQPEPALSGFVAVAAGRPGCGIRRPFFRAVCSHHGGRCGGYTVFV